MMELMRDLQNKKEHELRAQIEKEEIARAIKANNQIVNRTDLNNMENLRSEELHRMAQERETIRIKEMNLFDEIKKMESDLVDGDKKFQGNPESRNDFAVNYETEQRNKDKDMFQKQSEFAKQRAEQVAKIKLEREKLEHERQRIMQNLKDINQQKQPGGFRVDSRSSRRSNQAAQRAGSMLAGNKPPSAYSNNREGGALEPSLKDKIVRDQMRLNRLKEEAKSMPQLPQELETITAMQREMRQQQDPYDRINSMADEFASKNIPHKG